MQILIQKNNKDINSYIDVTSSIVSELTLDERIDQVLDSGTFSFYLEILLMLLNHLHGVLLKELIVSMVCMMVASLSSVLLIVINT